MSARREKASLFFTIVKRFMDNRKNAYFIPFVLLGFAFVLRILYILVYSGNFHGPDAHEYYRIAEGIARIIVGVSVEDTDLFFEYLSRRGPFYSLLLLAVGLVGGENLLALQIFQAFVDSLSCVLVFLIAKTVYTRNIGIIASLVYGIYPGFLYFTTFCCQETTTIFLLLLMVFVLVKAFLTSRRNFFFLSGILVAVLALYRPAFQFLFIPLFITVAVIILMKRLQLNRLLWISGGFASVAALWIVFAVSINIPVMLQGSSTWTIYETLINDGWATDAYDRGLEESFKSRGYDEQTLTQKNIDDPSFYLKAALKEFSSSPMFYTSQYLKRINRMWWYIETFPQRWGSPATCFQLLFHRSIIIVALLGISLTIVSSPLNLIFIILLLYGTGITLPISGVPRYALPFMPFVIMLASMTASCFYARIKEIFLERRYRRLLVFSPVMFFLILLVVVFDLPYLANIFPGTDLFSLYLVKISIINICIMGVFILVFFFFKNKFKSAILYSIIPIITITVLFSNKALTSKTWHEWETPLSNNSQIISQSIYLDNRIGKDNFEQAFVMVDMFPLKKEGYTLNITVNGEIIKSYNDGIKSEEGNFDLLLGGFYNYFFFEGYKLSPEDLRQWYSISLPFSLIENKDRVKIELQIEKSIYKNKPPVIIFGDYSHSKENIFQGPCFPKTERDTSIYKIMPYSGDYRFERITPLKSSRTVSRYFDGVKWHDSDLSGRRGVQSGVYRIRIKLIDEQGAQIIL